jgi:beta-1,4-mannosyltransferase
MLRRLGPALQSACEDADLLIAQVPPVLPGLWLAVRLAVRQQVPLVLDWHNLSAPMAALKLGTRHPAIPLLEKMETAIGRRAQAHFAVTEALAHHLSRRFSRPVYVLPDRPFPTRVNSKVSPLRVLASIRLWYTVVSPTSWSRDESMGLLLDAAAKITIPPGRGLRLVVTGKGPLRAAFEVRAATVQRPDLHIETGWFSAADYRGLLHHAHCGVSLHRSASGLDFPMKIIDMEAAGLPVLALDYGPVLHEGLTGLAEAATFTDAGELAGLLAQRLSADTWPRSCARPENWQDCWSRTALPVLSGLIP